MWKVLKFFIILNVATLQQFFIAGKLDGYLGFMPWFLTLLPVALNGMLPLLSWCSLVRKTGQLYGSEVFGDGGNKGCVTRMFDISFHQLIPFLLRCAASMC